MRACRPAGKLQDIPLCSACSCTLRQLVNVSAQAAEALGLCRPAGGAQDGGQHKRDDNLRRPAGQLQRPSALHRLRRAGAVSDIQHALDEQKAPAQARPVRSGLLPMEQGSDAGQLQLPAAPHPLLRSSVCSQMQGCQKSQKGSTGSSGSFSVSVISSQTDARWGLQTPNARAGQLQLPAALHRLYRAVWCALSH